MSLFPRVDYFGKHPYYINYLPLNALESKWLIACLFWHWLTFAINNNQQQWEYKSVENNHQNNNDSNAEDDAPIMKLCLQYFFSIDHTCEIYLQQVSASLQFNVKAWHSWLFHLNPWSYLITLSLRVQLNHFHEWYKCSAESEVAV